MSGKLHLPVIALALTSSAGAVGTRTDACLDCKTTTCALLPPDGSSFPCYEGALEDANTCYNTDPLLSSDTTYKCSTCEKEGYDLYLQNDPIYKNMELWTKSSAYVKHGHKSDACLDCADNVCALVPPSGSSFPCYQGNNEDANFCYNTDPLLPDGSSYQCGTCASIGYSLYIQNDPIYKNMELYSGSVSGNFLKGACGDCSEDLCSILPPAGTKFPCYQGTVADANKCFATDPLLNPNSTVSCNSCSVEGYKTYLRNDPIYKSMELWSHSDGQ